MKTGGIGGANTGTGLKFEKEVDLRGLLEQVPGYLIIPHPTDRMRATIQYHGETVALYFTKQGLYRYLDERGVEWRSRIAAKLEPDNAIVVIVRGTLYVLEVKYQGGSGSVDEKLQTCDYKKKFYQRLVAPLNLKVEFVFVLSRWFDVPRLRDVFDYITHVGCYYHFESVPLRWLGLPDPRTPDFA